MSGELANDIGKVFPILKHRAIRPKGVFTMGLKQLAKKVIEAGMDTGLGQAAINAGSDMLADQWKEYFYCDAIPVDVLVVKGQKRIGKKSQNTKGSDNLITNGSVIAVNSGQCMIIVDQGQVVEVCAETGEYVYDTSLEPSLFAGDFLGDFKKNVMDFIKATGRRITFGGDTARDQRIYFINTKEILDNKFGTPRPVPFRVAYEDIGRSFTVGLRCFGTYSYKIGNPLEFYEKVCGNVTDKYYRSQIDGQLKTEFFNYLQPAFGKLSQNVRYDELTVNTVPITEAMQAVLEEPWLLKRGIQIGTVAIESVNISPEDEERIKKYEDLAWQRDPANAAGIMVGAQAEALTAAASNPNGAMMGFYGMNMAQQAGGISANNLFAMAQQNKEAAAAAAPASGATGAAAGLGAAALGAIAGGIAGGAAGGPAGAVAGSWMCSCGASNTGKFCAECGTPKPADADGWTCSCGALNKGKFCSDCGAPKPSGAPKYRCDKCGWEPADPFNPPRFCGECGDPFNDDDIVK